MTLTHINAYMATLFGSEDLGLVLRVGLGKKLDPTCNTKSRILFSDIKQSRFDFNGYIPHFNDFLRLKSWDFAPMLVLVDMNGTWGPQVNRP
jgi:hypothetical protein